MALGDSPVGPATKRSGPMLSGAACIALAVLSAPAGADAPEDAAEAFAVHCFNPFMTAERAQQVLAAPGIRVDFYDLDPLSRAEPSPVVGREATRGTDRRCEVAFDGDHADLAVSAVVAGLEVEGIEAEAPLPDRYGRTDGTALLAARFLNPRRVAIVHVGTRPGPNGVETFMLVERMTPLEALQ